MKRVRWHDNERVDAPDMRAQADLVADYFALILTPLLGATGGRLSGMTILVDPEDPEPLAHAIVTAGVFVDSNRRVRSHPTSANLDLTGVVNVDGATCWARVGAAQLPTTIANRVVIVVGAEEEQAITTRFEDVTEFAAAAAGTPAGDGWIKFATIDSWVDVGGLDVPNVITYHVLFDQAGALHAWTVLAQAEIAEIKGEANWTTAPDRTIAALHAALALVEQHVAKPVWRGYVTGATGAVTHERAFGGAAVTVAWIGTGLYTVTLTGGFSATGGTRVAHIKAVLASGAAYGQISTGAAWVANAMAIWTADLDGVAADANFWLELTDLDY